MLSQEITYKIRGEINEETVTEMVDQFFRHGNTFLLFELMRLRSEVKSLRQELQNREDDKTNSLLTLIVP